MEHRLTWYIDYFLVHVQKSVLCFFTSLAQCINLQEQGANNDLALKSHDKMLVNIQ